MGRMHSSECWAPGRAAQNRPTAYQWSLFQKIVRFPKPCSQSISGHKIFPDLSLSGYQDIYSISILDDAHRNSFDKFSRNLHFCDRIFAKLARPFRHDLPQRWAIKYCLSTERWILSRKAIPYSSTLGQIVAKWARAVYENLVTNSKIFRKCIERISTSVVQNGDGVYILTSWKREVWENSAARDRLGQRFWESAHFFGKVITGEL